MRLWADETGSAALEFVATGLILLVPLVYLILTMAQLQAGAFAVDGAARQAARVFVRSDSLAHAQASSRLAVAVALADFGIDPTKATISVTCTPAPSACLTPHGFVTVTVTVGVPLPLVPPIIAVNVPLTVAVHATATQQVSRFWGTG
jgi:hypothetical protein